MVSGFESGSRSRVSCDRAGVSASNPQDIHRSKERRWPPCKLDWLRSKEGKEEQLTIARPSPPQTIFLVTFDHQFGELVDQRLLYLGIDGDRYGHGRPPVVALPFFPGVGLHHQLFVAQRTADALFALAGPPSLGPFNLVDLVRLRGPFGQLLKGSQAADELLAVAGTELGLGRIRTPGRYGIRSIRPGQVGDFQGG